MPRWLLWSLLAVVCWGLWAVTARFIGEALTAAQSQALSTLGILPVLLALASSSRSSVIGNARRGRIIAFASGAVVCAGNVAYYHALGLGEKAATVVPLTALYPVVTVLLATLLLRERLNAVQWAGTLLAGVAIWLFNVTGLAGLSSGWLPYALAPILLWGIGGFLQKLSTAHLSGELSTLWFLWAFVPATAGILWVDPLARSPEPRTWIFAAALGLLFGLGNLGLLKAFASQGKASVISPLAGLYPVVSVPAAILLFGERVGGREWAAIALAVAGAIALAWESPGAKTSE
ncbi:MAG TPA: hypothetical protein DCM86_18350 [Verrucomicrobiales bacterium]|nr:hypothetical protein [Verrucomicrobiales bacterium]